MEVCKDRRMQNSKKKIFACSYAGCSSTFNRPYRLQQHELVHQNIKPFTCRIENCTKSYTNKSHLDRHVNTAHKKTENEIIHSCPECMKTFKNRQNLKKHINRCHINVSYLCDICKKRFKKKNQLSAHMFQHNGIKAFWCDFCPKDFITLYEKKKHMRNHKTYYCETCLKTFGRWSQYVKHRRTDHISKEHICNDCGKSFKKKTHIIRHIKRHAQNTIRSFLCPYEYCERRYSRNSNLRQHIRMKHEKFTYDCSICMAQLCSKNVLQKHIRNVHDRKDMKIRTPKTLETGRNFRKDKNTLKCKIAALKLSGLPSKPIVNEHSVSLTSNLIGSEAKLESVCVIDNIKYE